MVALKCGQTLLGQYQVLTRQDLKSSTAILDPNQPGSTSLNLSWIWHSGKWLLMQDDTIASAEAGPSPSISSKPEPSAISNAMTLHECRFSTHLHFSIINSLVKCVHFLRVRALKNRWEEEHILLNYEMQWTV